MTATGQMKTTSRQFDYGWDSLGDTRDFRYWGDIAAWIGKNEKVLNKKSLFDCVKLLREQFPDLKHVEVRDFSGRGASM